MVVATTNPEPRPRLIDRYIIAALDAGITPILCITKTDLAPETDLVDYGRSLGITTVSRSPENPAREELAKILAGRISVAVGHSGVGKSTLVNELAPGAERAVGDVNDVTGRGRHTSSSSQALRLAEGGWVIDTPGVRSFGLGHVSTESIVSAFSDLAEYVAQCPKACAHTAHSVECQLARAQADETLPAELAPRVESLQRLMATIHEPGWQPE
jgi:ribosome biogenesis GTPase